MCVARACSTMGSTVSTACACCAFATALGRSRVHALFLATASACHAATGRPMPSQTNVTAAARAGSGTQTLGRHSRLAPLSARRPSHSVRYSWQCHSCRALVASPSARAARSLAACQRHRLLVCVRVNSGVAAVAVPGHAWCFIAQGCQAGPDGIASATQAGRHWQERFIFINLKQ